MVPKLYHYCKILLISGCQTVPGKHWLRLVTEPMMWGVVLRLAMPGKDADVHNPRRIRVTFLLRKSILLSDSETPQIRFSDIFLLHPWIRTTCREHVETFRFENSQPLSLVQATLEKSGMDSFRLFNIVLCA